MAHDFAVRAMLLQGLRWILRGFRVRFGLSFRQYLDPTVPPPRLFDVAPHVSHKHCFAGAIQISNYQVAIYFPRALSKCKITVAKKFYKILEKSRTLTAVGVVRHLVAIGL
jgi:hypothetical protein